MIEDEGSRKLQSGGFWILRKILGVIYPKLKEMSEIHGRRYVNHLIKKHPNQGIYIEKDISKDNLKKIIKELRKLKIDYAIKRGKKEGMYDLAVLGGNKTVVEMLMDNNKERNEKPTEKAANKANKNKSVLDKRLDAAKNKANELNASRPVKHRDIGAR